MKGTLSRILLFRKEDYFLIVRRKLFWILIPGLLAGFLAIMIVPDNMEPRSAEQRAPGAGVKDPQPYPLQFVLFAVLVGSVVGLGLALFSQAKEGSAQSESELARLTGVSVLASIPIIQDRESILSKDRGP